MTTESTLTAEIVTFRGLPGTSDEAIRRTAEALGPFLARSKGFVARTLSRDPGGTWTDHVLWTDETLARQAAESLMSDPAAAGFMELIDMASVRMTHGPVLVAQKPA